MATHAMTSPTLDLPRPLTLDDAVEHVATRTLTATGHRRSVGLELELHLVPVADPRRRPAWADVVSLVAGLPVMPGGSSVTLEPGGQVELSTPPAGDLVGAVAGLRADAVALRSVLATQGYVAAGLGADPLRAPQRINPHPRYAAMERHFDARGCLGPARQMMTATAALQVNLDAGAPDGWRDRLDHLALLAPVLVALSATSAVLGGRSSGWRSMRQQAWAGIDPARTAAPAPGEPGASWAAYALDAPVMLVREPGTAEPMRPVTRRVRFADWLRHPRLLGRAATRDDLDYHLTTLFPPVRPRGYVELRCLDAAPERWWPALATLATVLADDPVAADRAAEACSPLAAAGADVATAAERGLDDPAVRAAAEACAAAAADRAPRELAEEAGALAELVAAGRTPGDELSEVLGAEGPEALVRTAALDD